MKKKSVPGPYLWGDETHKANRKPAKKRATKKRAVKKSNPGSSSTVRGAKNRVTRKVYK